MTNETLIHAIGKIDDVLISDAINDTKAGKKYMWLRWTAACLCLIVGAIAVMQLLTGEKTVQDQLLAVIGVNGAVNNSLIETVLPIENRMAVYEQVYVGGSAYTETPESSDSTKKLLPFVGEIYAQNGDNNWYRVKGMEELKYLISESKAGTLRLWEYRSFWVADGEISDMWSSVIEQLPDIDLSPYTYGDVYRIIYNVENAEDIASITAAPSQQNNTDLGIKIQKQVGTHTYNDYDSIALFYDNTVNAVCNGENDWEDFYTEMDKYTYSFSTEEDNKISSGEFTWASRDLKITLTSGTTIDSWKYTALNGRFYQHGGIVTEPLAESEVYALNSIFGIE